MTGDTREALVKLTEHIESAEAMLDENAKHAPPGAGKNWIIAREVRLNVYRQIDCAANLLRNFERSLATEANKWLHSGKLSVKRGNKAAAKRAFRYALKAASDTQP